MTILEKLRLEKPEVEESDASIIEAFCPADFRIGCNDVHGSNCTYNCHACWNQEVPEEIIDKINAVGTPNVVSPEEIRHILDSGERREFETGAVRDIQEGKGRCDLMPLDVVSAYMSNEDNTYNQVLHNIYCFQKYRMPSRLFCAISEFFKQQKDWSDEPTMFLEVSKHFEEGAKKYGEHNWQKGIPTKCYIDSAVRHYLKWLRGDKDEYHDRAFVWNLVCCIWTCEHKPELNTYAGNNESN